MKYKANIRKQWKLRKFSFALEALFMGFLVDKKIASVLQTLTRKYFFKTQKIAPLWGFGTCYENFSERKLYFTSDTLATLKVQLFPVIWKVKLVLFIRAVSYSK